MNMTASYGTCDVFVELNSVGKELERLHPKLYSSVCRQICLTLTSEDVLHNVFTSVAMELFRGGDITWAKIIALYAITGGLASDCVRQGHVDYVLCLIESMGLFVERNLATWIAHQGGWNTLLTCFKPQEPHPYRNVKIVVGVLISLFVLLILWVIIK